MRQGRFSKVAAGLALGLGGLALLIWAKMKIVGGVPRTAYAEREHEPGEDPPAPERDDEDNH